MTEHADTIWYLLIISVNVLGGAFIALLVWSGKGKLGNIDGNIAELKTSHQSLNEKLEKGLERVHERVDSVEREMSMLKGEHNVFHRLIEKVES
jgi:hypothetical protein